LLELRRKAPPAHLAAALGALIARHDALRLRFAHWDGEWSQQATAPGAAVPFAVVDLSGLPDPIQAPAVEAAAAQAQTGLDLAHGPLLRALALQLGPGRTARLLLVVHH